MTGNNLASKTYNSLKEQGVKATLARTGDFLNRKLGRAQAPTMFERLGFINLVDLAGPKQTRDFIEVEDKLKIVWVVPPMGVGSGGHMTIFRMVHYLEKFGHSCEVVVFGEAGKGAEEIREMINTHFIRIEGKVMVNVDDFGDCDALIATSWETAYPVYDNASAKNRFYFVQDFEPDFSPKSSYSIFAEQTYRFGLNHITAGPWLEKLIKDNYGGKAQSFNLAYDKDKYYPRNQTKRNDATIVCYARPVTPRRGFELAVLALQLVKSRKPEVEIIFFGWDEYEELPFESTNAGILDHGSLAELYNRATIGLVISLTNYSLIPQEMMACKLPVIDIRGENTTSVFGDDNSKIILSEPTPHHIAGDIIQLLDNREKRDSLSENGYNYVKDFSWEQEARKVEGILLGH